MPLLLVPDPFDTDPDAKPSMPRSWAMRKLFESGVSIGDIARKYDVPYGRAYKSVNPPRQAVDAPRSTAAKPLTTKRLRELTRGQLERIAYMKQRQITSPTILARVQAANDELERRGLL